jgi:hypothetical protein
MRNMRSWRLALALTLTASCQKSNDSQSSVEDGIDGAGSAGAAGIQSGGDAADSETGGQAGASEVISSCYTFRVVEARAIDDPACNDCVEAARAGGGACADASSALYYEPACAALGECLRTCDGCDQPPCGPSRCHCEDGCSTCTPECVPQLIEWYTCMQNACAPTCGGCKGIGVACGGASDCCSQRCVDERCAAPTPVECGAKDAECVLPSQCCSFSCEDGACTALHACGR